MREYSPKRPPVAPRGYTLVESKTTKYGYQYYKYVRVPEKEAGGNKRMGRRLD